MKPTSEFDNLPPIEDLKISVPEVLCDPLGEVLHISNTLFFVLIIIVFQFVIIIITLQGCLDGRTNGCCLS